ncbi:MAG: hypothetical protein K0S67_29 [Nitrososphaeraceae archaeon]|jgi:DNA-directed RNA polymerase subunit RPC12/RpoP|nr:hypothetical protein [Nitrososphaeraceae archaeon]
MTYYNTNKLTNLFSTDDIQFDEKTTCDKCGGKRFRYTSLLIKPEDIQITFHCIDCEKDFSIPAELEVKEEEIIRKILVVTDISGRVGEHR